MKLLGELVHVDGLDRTGKTLTREAVRAIVICERSLLMLFSPVIRDYKLPGGGVNQGETHQEALARELQEEGGAGFVQVGAAYGKVVEYAAAIEREYDVFSMTSVYYVCRVGGELSAQRLDNYERDLGLHPVWIDIDEAIRSNTALLSSGDHLPWTKRETFVLKLVKQHLIEGAQ